MIYLLETIVSNDSEEVRIAACRLFASITGNNKKVQWFASLAGAVNLSVQFERENTAKAKEVVLGSLLAFLKAENFAGKVQFIEDFEGLRLLVKWILDCDVVPDKDKPEEFKYGNKAQNRKIKLKLLQLLNDLVLNDDSILPGGNQIRALYS